jgi:glycosyltransferase involved in cell wall biosynthesis
MTVSPRISIVLPVYGHEPHLGLALSSLAEQTYSDFEIVVVTDDVSPTTRREIDNGPDRMTVIEHDSSGGLSGALNVGIENATGEFIARMDGDDLSMQNRLQRQVEFLDSNPEVGVLGGACERIDQTGASHGVIIPPSTHLGIRWRLLLTSCIPHPTAMIRRSVLEETGIRYRPEFNAAEDYDLWTRLASKTKLRNLDEPLIKYRIAGDRKSERDATEQKKLGESIATRTVDRYLPNVDFSEKEVIAMQGMLYRGASESADKRKVSIDCFELFRQFEQEYGDPDVSKEVSRDFSVTLARSILRPPIQANSFGQLVQLLSVDPVYPLALTAFLLERRTRL